MSSGVHAAGQVFLFCLLVIACGAVLRHVAMAAFARAPAPGRAGRGTRTALRSPAAPRAVRGAGRAAGRSAAAVIAHPGNRQIRAQARADTRRLWETARSTDWLEQQRHARAAGPAAIPAPPAGGAGTVTRPGLRQRLRLRPFTPDGPDPASGGSAGGPDGEPRGFRPGDKISERCPDCGEPDGDPHHPRCFYRPRPAPRSRNGSAPQAPPAPPEPPPPGTAPPPSTNGGTTVPAPSGAASEQMIEAIQAIYAHAASGGLTAKQEALRAAHEADVRFASMKQMLARTMSEPGSNYGPEITEPLARSAQHSQAAAMSTSEADAALETLANMTLREVSTSPRQAPHHSELSESRSG